MTNNAAQILGALGEVSSGFRELASNLRNREFVISVVHPVRISSVPRRIEWFTDAELIDGRAVSFALDVRLDGDEWIVDSAIRVVDGMGEDDLLELATRYALGDTEFLSVLNSAAMYLFGLRDQALAALGYGP